MHIRKPVFVVAVLLLTTAAAVACSVPVFRYALEHWIPDPYVLTVFHRGPLSPEHQTMIQQLQPETETGLPAANLVVRTVDLDDQPTDAMQQLWAAHSADELPRMILQAPPKWGPAETVWSSELTSENAALVLDSPVRSEIRNRLLNQDSVVWIYLESGIQEDDDAAFQLLVDELKTQQSQLQVPEIAPEDLHELAVDPESLKISFSAIRLSRDAPKEQALVEMLLRIEPDLLDDEYIHQPMAFPVFGRGRALYALVGNGIAADLIGEACQFLSAGCQCTVKAQNPGVDLLMLADWDASLIPLSPSREPLPPLTGFSGFQQPAGDPADEIATPAATAVPLAAEPEVLAANAPVAHQPAAVPDESTADETSEVGLSDAGDSAATADASEQLTREVDKSLIGSVPREPGTANPLARGVMVLLLAGIVIAILSTFLLMPKER